MKVSVFTPTSGKRPRLLDLCRAYVAEQTHPVHEHFVVEGGSLAANLHHLPEVSGDVVVIFEDDDWYSPDWIRWCVDHLVDHDVVGEQATRFYHVPTRGYAVVGTGPQRSSLCNTAFRRELIPDLLAEVRENFVPIDLHFWGRVVSQGRRVCCNPGTSTTCHSAPCHLTGCGVPDPASPPYYVVGIKGLSDRGMSFSHNPGYYRGFHQDPEGKLLRSWVGDDDAVRYLTWPLRE